MVNPRTIKCGHVFCEDCLKRALGILNICPICKEPQGIVTGNQPPGQMTWSSMPSSLPGHYGKSLSLRFDFSFANMIKSWASQVRAHPLRELLLEGSGN